MNASVGGMGADLNMANAVTVAGYNFNVIMTRDGQELDGRVSLLVDSDGPLVDSWIGRSASKERLCFRSEPPKPITD